MENLNRVNHWEHIYKTKALNEVSWYQPKPETSLSFFTELQVSPEAKILDVGGGDSFLVDYLLDLGYLDLTVLDISATAIERAKSRLGERAKQVKWIVSDILDFVPQEQYDVWHDRAAFHFLTEDKEVEHYVETTAQGIADNGVLILGTFSENGPKKCSGIPIQQYSESSMIDALQTAFSPIRCISVEHPTPFNTVQQFTFCSFRRKSIG
jgi:2-polyprenyl-3-methyl-5-hydroxy-6-metoxy-1,4-benzoquinol methylase